jgi:hypothetical protein
MRVSNRVLLLSQFSNANITGKISLRMHFFVRKQAVQEPTITCQKDNTQLDILLVQCGRQQSRITANITFTPIFPPLEKLRGNMARSKLNIVLLENHAPQS